MKTFLQILFFFTLVTQIHYPQLTSQFSGSTVSVSDITFISVADTLGPELIINGDMEFNTYWDAAWSPYSSLQSTDFAHGGLHSWKTVTQSGSGTASSYSLPQLEVIEDSLYWVDAYVYILSGTAGITIFTDTYNQMWSSDVTGEWLHVSFSFVAANLAEPGFAYIYFLGNSGGTSTFYIDDVSIKQRIAFENPLPVELISFTAAYKNAAVMLNWVTKTEVNNYGFNIERRINEGEWNSIGFIKGHGNSNSPKNYSYNDKDLFAGGSNFQYRLKQVDTDGQFEYSDVVGVEVVPTQFELSQNYPNPFNPTTTIRFSLPMASQIKITIYNMIGEQILTLAEGMYESGNHKVTFNASNFPSGAYIYRIESNEFVQVKKMILMK